MYDPHLIWLSRPSPTVWIAECSLLHPFTTHLFKVKKMMTSVNTGSASVSLPLNPEAYLKVGCDIIHQSVNLCSFMVPFRTCVFYKSPKEEHGRWRLPNTCVLLCDNTYLDWQRIRRWVRSVDGSVLNPCGCFQHLFSQKPLKRNKNKDWQTELKSRNEQS